MPYISPPHQVTTAAFFLYAIGSPYGNCVAITLEEIKAKDPALAYDWKPLDLSKKENKEEWFLKINPNGRIPVLIDRSKKDFVVFESSAILLHLAQHYDKSYAVSFDPQKEPEEYGTMLQWIFLGHGSVGPMTGEAIHFNINAKKQGITDDLSYPNKRYQEEVRRLYGVLEMRLKDRDYLVGSGRGRYSLADIQLAPWLRVSKFAGIEGLDEWPAVQAWVQRCEARPGFKAGIEAVPF